MRDIVIGVNLHPGRGVDAGDLFQVAALVCPYAQFTPGCLQFQIQAEYPPAIELSVNVRESSGAYHAKLLLKSLATWTAGYSLLSEAVLHLTDSGGVKSLTLATNGGYYTVPMQKQLSKPTAASQIIATRQLTPKLTSNPTEQIERLYANR